MGKKRKNDSPKEQNEQAKPVKQRKKKNKMAQSGSPNNSQVQTPQTPAVCQGQSFSLPPVYQYPGQYMQNATSPQFFQSQPIYIPAQNITNGHNGQNNDNHELLVNISKRLDVIDKKLGQLDSIQSSISSITNRLNCIEKKFSDIEKSQTFVSEQYETMSETIETQKHEIQKMGVELQKLTDQNHNLKTENKSVKEDVIDLKCRSMRDNLLFFGIPEEIRGQAGSAEPRDDNQLSNGGGAAVQDPGTTASSRLPAEDCTRKVHEFCRDHLKIDNPAECIHIDRAHRIGSFTRGKTRPIVAKFLNTNSKNQVKSCLRNVDLRQTPFNVKEQYPEEILQRRRDLIDVWKTARRDGKRAVLVRDKLYINGQLYVPRFET